MDRRDGWEWTYLLGRSRFLEAAQHVGKSRAKLASGTLTLINRRKPHPVDLDQCASDDRRVSDGVGEGEKKFRGMTLIDSNGVLARLQEDHGRFERFFQAIEEQCACLEAGKPADMVRLKAIVAHLGAQAFPRHHALEDAIFAHIVKHMPYFRVDIFDLSEDHRTSQREFRRLVQAVEKGNGTLVDAARSFVANERGHFISEEEILFRYATRVLSDDQWQVLGKSQNGIESDEAPSHDLRPIEDLLAQAAP